MWIKNKQSGPIWFAMLKELLEQKWPVVTVSSLVNLGSANELQKTKENSESFVQFLFLSISKNLVTLTWYD